MVPSTPARSPLAALSLTVLLAPLPAGADWDERFAPFAYDTADPGRLYLQGAIDDRSALVLGRAIDALGEPRELVLSSPGGSVYAALLMAREIDRLGLATTIPAGAACYSACAFLFFAGADRQAEGELGVHQISSDVPDLDSGQVALSDIVEALTAYGVPNEVLVLMLRTSADDIHVLSPEEMSRYGLLGPRKGGTELALSAPIPDPGREVAPHLAPDAALEASASPEAAAVELLEQYQRDWSEANPLALARIRLLYADRVTFYGDALSLDAVMEDKEAFVERWPVRSYALDTATASASCASPTTCTVEGEVTWNALRFDGARRSVGRAQVELTVQHSGGLWLITDEGGHVIERD